LLLLLLLLLMMMLLLLLLLLLLISFFVSISFSFQLPVTLFGVNSNIRSYKWVLYDAEIRNRSKTPIKINILLNNLMRASG
jgi:hypothetical protein